MVKNADKIVLEIYQAMYKISHPKADFKKLMKAGTTKKPEWFMKYYLDIDKQQAIIDKVCKKYKLDKYDTSKVQTEIYLGCSPTSIK